MQVKITHKEDMKFEAQTEKSSFVIDCPTISPIEYFLAGLIACSASDIVSIPPNQGYEVSNLEVTGDVIRNEDMPRKFNDLHLTYSFTSSADDALASRWVMASIETYCSTINTVRGVTQITFSVVYNGVLIKDKAEIISGETGNTDFGSIDGCCPS